MSLLNSMLGSLSPTFRRSFEDPHSHEHELPLYTYPPSSPRVPPPIVSTVLWNSPNSFLSPPARVPDDLLAIQRRARYLEQQLQELLDAQADGLISGLAGNETRSEDLVSNGSTTPTVSSVRDHDRESESPAPRKKKINLNAARRGISKRIQQLASVKAEETNLLDGDSRDLQDILHRIEVLGHKRSRLTRRIRDIEGESTGARTKELQDKATKLEQDIRLKEEELFALKSQHRRVLDELADSENSVEAKLSSYKDSLSQLDQEIARFLARPPDIGHVSRSKSPFLSLPPKRRTLEMAHDYWQEEHERLTEKSQEVTLDRSALEDGSDLWNDVVKKVMDFETRLQKDMQQAGRMSSPDPSGLLNQMDSTVSYLVGKHEHASANGWNLLVCAIGAELEAFEQGREILEQALGRKGKEKEKTIGTLVDTASSPTESEEGASSSAIRIGRSPPKAAFQAKPKFFDTDDEDPDPELMISKDTDTD